MAFPQPTQTTGDSITASIWNGLVANLNLLKTAIDNAGNIAPPARTTLTLSSNTTGAVTPVQNAHAVDTFTAAAAGDLATLTIAGSIRDGHLLILTAANVAHVVTVRDGTGNISLAGGDYPLASTKACLLLQLIGTTWVEVSRSSDILTPVTTTVTGVVNDLNPGLCGNTLLRCNNASALQITGLTGGYDGQRVVIESVGAGDVQFTPEGTGSAAAARFTNIATSGPTYIAAGAGRLEYVYDGALQRWILVSHHQGTSIQQAFNAANFTANGSMTWTVGAGAVVASKWILQGRLLTMNFDIGVTTIGGTANTTLQMKIFGGFTAAVSQNSVIAFTNGNGVAGYAFVTAVGGSNILSIRIDRSIVTNWTLGVSAIVTGTVLVEVQ